MPNLNAAASGPIDLTPVATRLGNAVRYLISGKPPLSWFGPGQPLQPAAQTEAVGREFDYPVTQNINYQPRSLEPITFDMLKNLAVNYDLLRIILETRKDQMVKLKWDIVVSDDAKDAGVRKLDPKVRQPLLDLWRRPDGVHSWQQWLRVIMDQMLVIDAATLFPRRTLKGDIVRVDYVDGATINRLVNGEGRTPLPPDPAYQQVLHGLPAVNYTVNDLLYAPRNVRADKLFGYSPVEQVLMTAMIGLKRELHQLAAYTDGNVPEAVAMAPTDWTPDQITKFQKNFDSMLSGDLQKRRRVRFIPGGGKFELLKPSALFDQFDEWLIRIICFTFSIPPTAFIKSVNRASSDSMKETAMEEGLLPNMLWVADVVNQVIHDYMGIKEASFEWQNERDTDPKDQMTTDTGYAKLGVKTIDEVRDELGMDPLPDKLGATPLVFTATGAVPLVSQVNPPAPAAALKPPEGDPAVSPGGEATPPSPDGQATPGAGGSSKPPVAAGANGAAATGEDSVGHTAGKAGRLRKKVVLKPINRQRDAAKQASKQLKTLFAEALWKDGAAAAKLVGAKVTAATKTGGGGPDQLVKQVMDELALSGLAATTAKAEAILAGLAADGGAQALAQIGLEDDQALVTDVHARAVKWAKGKAAELVTGVDQTTRDQLRVTVTSALEEGLSGGDLARQIRGSFGFSADRADMIARTESAAADVAGNLTAYKASGVVSKKYWVISDDHPTPDECNDNAGQGAIDLDDDFSSGDPGPPAHPNCECDVIPVIEE